LLALRVIWPDGYSRRTRADGNDPAGKRGDQDGERPWRDPLRRGPGFRPVLLCITRGPTDAGTDSDLAAQLADRYHGRQLRPARLAQRSRAIPRTSRSRCTRATPRRFSPRRVAPRLRESNSRGAQPLRSPSGSALRSPISQRLWRLGSDPQEFGDRARAPIPRRSKGRAAGPRERTTRARKAASMCPLCVSRSSPIETTTWGVWIVAALPEARRTTTAAGDRRRPPAGLDQLAQLRPRHLAENLELMPQHPAAFLHMESAAATNHAPSRARRAR
jgi:hypothetical protein